ncbi:MAG TPA: hypothetical protein VHT91_43805 [Kofleriaceae bacterium]|nr:hypothetical protein [Kofleriaceae bacterium]
MTRRRRPPEAAAWPGRHSIVLAIGGLIVAASVWWLAARDPLQAAGARVASGAAPAPVAAPSASPGAPRPAVAALPPAPVTPYPAGGTPGVAADDPLTAYRKANVYPPTSRPLTADQVDLLRPGQRHETMRPDDHGAGITYLFTADRYFVIGDETLTATLDVRRGGAPIPVAITQAYAAVMPPGGSAPRIPLAFAPSGSILAAQLAPARLDLARQAAIGIYIEFDPGSGRQAAHFDVQYTPARGIPARFTGAFRDAIETGSLVIHAGVAVDTPGRYVIDCNLFDAADQPVAWSRFKGELAAGVHDADLMFFGKVILDGHARGPFHIGQLRGARFAPGLDPDLEQMPPFPGSYTTAPYPPDVFSDAEYDSPDKQRMLELLGQDRNHRGAAGQGAGSD